MVPKGMREANRKEKLKRQKASSGGSVSGAGAAKTKRTVAGRKRKSLIGKKDSGPAKVAAAKRKPKPRKNRPSGLMGGPIPRPKRRS